MMAGDVDNRISLHFLRNQRERPGHSEYDLRDLRDVRRDRRLHGQRFVGMVHSHVVGYAKPGPGTSPLRSSRTYNWFMTPAVERRASGVW